MPAVATTYPDCHGLHRTPYGAAGLARTCSREQETGDRIQETGGKDEAEIRLSGDQVVGIRSSGYQASKIEYPASRGRSLDCVPQGQARDAPEGTSCGRRPATTPDRVLGEYRITNRFDCAQDKFIIDYCACSRRKNKHRRSREGYFFEFFVPSW